MRSSSRRLKAGPNEAGPPQVQRKLGSRLLAQAFTPIARLSILMCDRHDVDRVILQEVDQGEWVLGKDVAARAAAEPRPLMRSGDHLLNGMIELPRNRLTRMRVPVPR